MKRGEGEGLPRERGCREEGGGTLTEVVERDGERGESDKGEERSIGVRERLGIEGVEWSVCGGEDMGGQVEGEVGWV